MTTVFSDTCTDVDATQLQSHAPETGTGYTRLHGTQAALDCVITSNQINPESDADDGVIYTCDATYDSADYYFQWTLVALSTTAARSAIGLVRVQDVENMYAVYLRAGGNASSLYKKVAGTWSALGSGFTAPANGSVCKLEIIGTALKFYDDGVEIASASDSDIAATGKAGLAFGGGAELITSTDDAHSTNIFDTLTVVTTGAPAADEIAARFQTFSPGVMVLSPGQTIIKI